MKGTLKKLDRGWIVAYEDYDTGNNKVGFEITLSPEDKLNCINDSEGKEVEFEIVEKWNMDKNIDIPNIIDIKVYAKLI